MSSSVVCNHDQECHICLSKITFKVTLNWGHKFWKPWVQEFWKERIMKKYPPSCPDWWGEIDHQIKLAVLPPELMEKYQEFQRQKSVDRDPNLHWCPAIDCDNFVYWVPDVNGAKTKATWECGFEFCIVCHEEWHKSKCFKHSKSTAKSIFKNKKIKRWPRWKTNIQKITGCNHMTCAVWLHQFWWNWGEDYHPSHYGTFSIWSLEGESRGDLLVAMLILPLILFFFPFTVLFSMRKLSRECIDFYWYGSISWTLWFWTAFILGFFMQAFYPYVMLFLFTTWVRFYINKFRFRY